MSLEKAIPGTPGRSVDALLEPLSDALERLRARMLTDGFTISPSEVNALNNLQGVLLMLAQGALPEVRSGLSGRILREVQPLLLLAGLMASLSEMKEAETPEPASTSRVLELPLFKDFEP